MKRTGLIVARSIVLVPLVLAACGQASDKGAGNASGGITGAFDQGFKTEYRRKFVENCRSSAEAAIPANARATAMPIMVRMCDCSVEKVMTGASMRDLASPSPEKLTTAAKECMAEQGMPVPK